VKPAILLSMIRGIDHLAQALLRRMDVDLIALHGLGSDILLSKAIPHRKLNDFLTPELSHDAFAQAEGRAVAVMKCLLSADCRQEWAVGGSGTWAGCQTAIKSVVQRDFAEEIILIDLIRRIACETDIRLVLASEDICRDARTAITCAQRVGIPGLHVLHGFMYGTRNAHDTVTADVIAAYSQRSKDTYVGFGAHPDHVRVTGNPMWDVYCRPPLPGFRERVCEDLGLAPNRPIIEYALTNVHRFSAVSINHPEYHLETAEAVIDAFATLSRRHPDWQFLLRPHPSDHDAKDRLLERASEAGLADLRVDRQLPYDSVVTADVMLCTHSNLGVEALLLGKPVINVAIDRLAGPVFQEGEGPLFLEDDAILWAREADEIAPLVEKALSDSSTRQRLSEGRPATAERYNYLNDGKATDRVCALVQEMMEHPARFVQPVARWPEFEPGLADAVPAGASTILVVGRAARHVADAVSSRRPDAAVTTADSPGQSRRGPFDAVVLADPVPHDAGAEALLEQARDCINGDGMIIAAFRNGGCWEAAESFVAGRWVPRRPGAEPPAHAAQFSWVGIEVLLSRCGLDSLSHADVSNVPEALSSSRNGAANAVQASIVQARPRPNTRSPFGQRRFERREHAAAANARGEAAHAEGDVVAAANGFIEAINAWGDEALYFNNLATALHGLGRSGEAWDRILDALHLEPSSQTVRANLRMIAHALGRDEAAADLLGLFGADMGG
jgi:CDP-Glycerol:Poly(glycerophosphate) glycerophosphotransferase